MAARKGGKKSPPTSDSSSTLPETPIRAALVQESTLRPSVCDGIGAVESSEKCCIEAGIRARFKDSLDLDTSTRKGKEQENRWDYLLGYEDGDQGVVIGLEPHTATTTGEVSVVIKKRAAAREHLKQHLRSNAHVAAWFWVATGPVHFVPYEKAINQLSQAGIEFVGKALLAKHLPKRS